jgi:hypothetical protein
VNPDGTFTPEFQEVTGMMAHAGVWDQLHDSYIRQLEAAAADPNLPEEEKPTPEDIRRARAERRIPSP